MLLALLGGAVSVLMASKAGVVDAVVSAHPGFLVSPGLSLEQCQATRDVGCQLRYAAAIAFLDVLSNMIVHAKGYMRCCAAETSG